MNFNSEHTAQHLQCSMLGSTTKYAYFVVYDVLDGSQARIRNISICGPPKKITNSIPLHITMHNTNNILIFV